MIISGAYSLPAPPALVYDKLTDPACLQQAITGCEKLEKSGEDDYIAHLKLGLAAIKGSYTGKVSMRDKQPPNRFTLLLEGKGGPGFVRGKCLMELKPEGKGTQLTYSADIQVGGLIAAVGSRMIEAAGKKLADDFFKKIATLLAAR